MGDTAVQRHMESMAEDFIEIKRLKLMDEKKLNHYIKKRNDNEWKINGVVKSIEDIEEAIAFEKLFLKEILKRRVKKQLFEKKRNIDYRIMNRIKSYYEIGCMRYPENYEFALNFFKFLKAIKTYHSATAHLLKSMIDRFQYIPEIFEVASSWFKQHDEKTALSIIHRGIALHPENKDLYLDAFEFEAKRDSPDKEERLKTYVREVFKNIKSFQFIIDIIKLLDQHRNVFNIQNEIIKQLFEVYKDEEGIWDLVAQRELNGFPYDDIIKDSGANSTKNRLKRCIDTYEIGMSKLSQEKKNKLNISLLDTLINFQKQNTTAASISRAEQLKQKLQEAKYKHKLKLEKRHYAAWIDLCENDSDVVKLLEEATESLPKCHVLWELYLKFYILKDGLKEIGQIFEKSIKALGDQALTIWEVMIDYYYLRLNNTYTEALFIRAIETQPERISSVFKPRYLSWILLNKGIQEARDFYNKIAEKKPYCLELHEEMAKIEYLECFELDHKNWQNCLQLTCKQFGNLNVDVWISYIKFYKEHYKGLDANEKIKEIYTEAQIQLPELLVPDFKEKFSSFN